MDRPTMTCRRLRLSTWPGWSARADSRADSTGVRGLVGTGMRVGLVVGLVVLVGLAGLMVKMGDVGWPGGVGWPGAECAAGVGVPGRGGAG